MPSRFVEPPRRAALAPQTQALDRLRKGKGGSRARVLVQLLNGDTHSREWQHVPEEVTNDAAEKEERDEAPNRDGHCVLHGGSPGAGRYWQYRWG